MTTSKLLLPELSVSQASKEITHNQALAILDQVTQARVLDKDLTAPPGSPANGAAYIVASGATGAWAGKDGKIAYWLDAVGEWSFANPLNGWLVYVDDENKHYRLESGAWVVLATGGGGMTNPMTTLGDLIKGGASGTPARIPVGANGQVLTVVAGEPAWAASSGGGADNSTETVAISAGALNLSATTKETIVVSLNANVTSITMPSGTGGQVVNRRVVFTNTGSFTVTGWTGVTIEGGVAPTAATGAGAVTEYMLSNVDNGGWRMYVDQQRRVSPYATAGGTANALTLSTNHIPSRLTSYAQGDKIRARVSTTNTGAMTLAVDGLSAVAVKTVTGVDTPAGYIRTDVDTEFTYDGTYWRADRQTEYGSNASGEFWRYAEGSLRCINVLLSSSSADVTWNYPASFIALPNTDVSARSDDRVAVPGATYTVSTYSFKAYLLPGLARSVTQCSLTANGRWY